MRMLCLVPCTTMYVRDFDTYRISNSSIPQCYMLWDSQQGVLVRVALATKMADAQVEYKRVDLQSYEARNGASLAQSFKYKFSFPSMYRRLKSTQN